MAPTWKGAWPLEALGRAPRPLTPSQPLQQALCVPRGSSRRGSRRTCWDYCPPPTTPFPSQGATGTVVFPGRFLTGVVSLLGLSFPSIVALWVAGYFRGCVLRVEPPRPAAPLEDLMASRPLVSRRVQQRPGRARAQGRLGGRAGGQVGHLSPPSTAWGSSDHSLEHPLTSPHY